MKAYFSITFVVTISYIYTYKHDITKIWYKYPEDMLKLMSKGVKSGLFNSICLIKRLVHVASCLGFIIDIISFIMIEPGHTKAYKPGAVARSEASWLGMQAAPSSVPTSGTFFHGDLVMKTLRPFSFFRWFKKSSCQLLAKECAISTGKPPRRLAQEQCG